MPSARARWSPATRSAAGATPSPRHRRTRALVRTAIRVWETRRWQQQGGFALEDWDPLREAICDALVDGPMTRGELSARLARTAARAPQLRGYRNRADSLYEPLHWWGDICFGLQRDGRSTFRLLRDDPPGLLDVDDAGRALVIRYLGSYGPATRTHLHYWFTEGLGAPNGDSTGG